VLPAKPSFPAMEELVRAARAHEIRPVGPPMTEEQAHALIARVLAQQTS